MGAATGDLNGDGWLDLVIVEWGRDRVFLNDGGKGFTEVETSGLSGERWGTWTYDGFQPTGGSFGCRFRTC